MTRTAQIITALQKLQPTKHGFTCGEIASECNLTRSEVQAAISAVVCTGKVKRLRHKENQNAFSNPCNIYCLVREGEENVKQMELI